MPSLLRANDLHRTAPEVTTAGSSLTITTAPLTLNPTTATTNPVIFTHVTPALFSTLAQAAAHVLLPHELYALVQRLHAANIIPQPKATVELLVSHYPQQVGNCTVTALPTDELLPASYAVQVTYPTETGAKTGLYLGNWGSYSGHKKRLKTVRKALLAANNLAWATVTGTLADRHNNITTAAINQQLSAFCTAHAATLIQIKANWLMLDRWLHLAAALHGSGRHLVVSPQLAALVAPTLPFDQNLYFLTDATPLSTQLARHPQLTPVTKAAILAAPEKFGMQATDQFNAPEYVVPETPATLTLTAAATVSHYTKTSNLKQLAATLPVPCYLLD